MAGREHARIAAADAAARTLSIWRQRFDAAWREKKLPRGYDERFRRICTYYLAYCEGGFRGGSIDVCQLLFRRKE